MEAKTATPGPRFIEPALNDIERIAERLRVDGRTTDGITKECAADAIDKIVRIARNCGVVRVCNAHDDLVEALTTCMRTLQKLQRCHTDYPDGSSKYEPPHHSILSAGQEGPNIDFGVALARAALAAAEQA